MLDYRTMYVELAEDVLRLLDCNEEDFADIFEDLRKHQARCKTIINALKGGE